jgi:hypothetical protein
LAKKIGLSDTDLEELFSYFDTDGSGNVEPDEFATLLAACGLPLRENMVDAIVSQIDKDHDGKISFDEFADFFVARHWGFDAANMTEEDKLRFVTGRPSESKLGEFEWDFGLTYDENVIAMGEAKRAEAMTGNDRANVMQKHHDMLMLKLLLPLWIKQAVKHINDAGVHDPAGRSQNQLSVQVGEPQEDKAYAEAYFKGATEADFASLSPPNDACGVAGAVDFGIRDGVSDEKIEALATELNRMHHEIVMPFIHFWTSHIPRGLTKSGMINGPVFDSITFGVVTIKGKKYFRISGFSGVDLTAIFKDCVVDLNHLLADVNFKVSTGFGLSDLTAEGTTSLKDMLTAKVELNVSWHVKMAEVASRMAIRYLEFLKGQEAGGWRIDDQLKSVRALLGGCKFFQAQRSLVFFQFESIFHVVGDLIKTMGLPALFQKLEEMCGEMGVGPLFDAPPSLEIVDAVLDAVGGITGKTFGSLRKHFLSDVNGPEAMKFLALLKQKINEMIERRVARDCNSAETKWLLEGIGLYFRAQETLSGFEGVKVISKIHQMGLRLKGLGDFFKLLPSKAEYDAAKVPKREEIMYSDRNPIPWVVKYAHFLAEYLQPGGGPAQPKRPSDEYLNELREDFSEIVDIVKAGIPYLDHFQRDKYADLKEEDCRDLADKAEKEAKWMFGLIDEDAASAAFDQAVADGFKPEPDDDRPMHQREEPKYNHPGVQVMAPKYSHAGVGVQVPGHTQYPSKYDPYEGNCEAPEIECKAVDDYEYPTQLNPLSQSLSAVPALPQIIVHVHEHNEKNSVQM